MLANNEMRQERRNRDEDERDSKRGLMSNSSSTREFLANHNRPEG